MQRVRELMNDFVNGQWSMVNCQMIFILSIRSRIVCYALIVSTLLVTGLAACSSDSDSKRKKLPVNASQSWTGTWVKSQFQNVGKLEIIKVNRDSIQFELHASSGGHESGVEGIAIATDSTISIYSSKEGVDSCTIEFKLVGDSIVVVKESGTNCFASIGVIYSGDYKNENLLPVDDQDENKTLLDLDIFKTKEQDSIFRSLVGDNYSLFVKSTQLTSEDDDVDGLNAIVKSSAVRGLYTIMENIIMIDTSTNNIWAAVIDDEQRVIYFTTSKEYRNKLPNAIENWRKNFKHYPVIYQK